MRMLVTAGNTQVPLDRVRCITNIFTGRTGAAIARHAHESGHSVTLLTSHPETAAMPSGAERWRMLSYRSYDDLHDLLSGQAAVRDFDAVVHCAAVSDYRSAGVYAPAPGTAFDESSGCWTSATGGSPALVSRLAGKVKSNERELWLRLVPTPKLIDLFRSPWGFRGILVKFKLEVDTSDEQLLAIAEQSRRQSAADLVVANTLEGAAVWAFLGPLASGGYDRISRPDLPTRLLLELERLHEESKHA